MEEFRPRPNYSYHHRKYSIDYFNLIIPEIAKKFNLREAEVEFCMRTQWEYLRDKMTDEQWDNIKIKHIGSFKANTSRIRDYNVKQTDINKGRLDKLVEDEIKDGKLESGTSS